MKAMHSSLVENGVWGSTKEERVPGGRHITLTAMTSAEPPEVLRWLRNDSPYCNVDVML